MEFVHPIDSLSAARPISASLAVLNLKISAKRPVASAVLFAEVGCRVWCGAGISADWVPDRARAAGPFRDVEPRGSPLTATVLLFKTNPELSSARSVGSGFRFSASFQ